MLKTARILVAFVLALLAAGPVFAAAFEEGKHYTVVAEDRAADPVVLEFFSYGCGGCFVFDSWFQSMKAAIGDKVEVKYIPVDFGGGFWTPAQELFLVMDALGKREQLHRAAFAYIHTEGHPITAGSARKFLAEHGVSEARYNEVRESFAVHVKEQRYDQLAKRYRISSTPTVIVNGKYQVMHTELTGPAEFVELVKYLLSKP